MPRRSTPTRGFVTKTIPSYGGGLNFAVSPLAIDDDQWVWSEGFLARDGYAELLDGYSPITSSPLGAAGDVITGIVEDWPSSAAGAVNPRALVSVAGTEIPFNDTAQGKLYRVEPTGAFAVLTITNPPWLISRRGVATGGRFNQQAIITGGGPSLSVGSVIKWAGGSATVVQEPFLAAEFLTMVGGHMMAAYCKVQGGVDDFSHQVAWCNALSATDPTPEETWLPAVSNSADNFTLDAVGSLGSIAGLIRVSSSTAILLTTAPEAVILQSTGGLPAFTAQLIPAPPALATFVNFGPVGYQKQFQSFVGAVPQGVCYLGYENVYVAGAMGATPIGDRVARYMLSDVTDVCDPAIDHGRPIFYHPRLDAIVVPRPQVAGGLREAFYYRPREKAWSRALLLQSQNVVARRHAFVRGVNNAGKMVARHWIAADDRNIYQEDPTIVRYAGSGPFIISKGFTFGGAPSADAYVDRVRVEWEPLTNASTDALQISVCALNSISNGILGDAGAELANLPFTVKGTLTGGAAELPIRARGKVIFFKLAPVSGKVRIRGLAIRHRPASPRATVS